MAAEYVRVASLSDVPEGSKLALEIGGERICLANAEGTIYALRNNCTHKDFPLSEGQIEDHRIECAWHGAKFDLPSGRAVALPAIRPVKTFEVRINGGDIYVLL